MISKIPFCEYKAIDALNGNGLKHFMRSPSHYLHNKENPKPPTPAMEFGTLCHSVCLEYDKAVNQYYTLDEFTEWDRCLNKDGSTSKKPKGTEYYTNWLAGQAEKGLGKELVDQDDWNTAVKIRKAVQAHPVANKLLAMGGKVEHTIQWTHPTGVLMKGRPDKYIPDYHADYGLVVDLKTTDNASVRSFARTIANFRYDISVANYCEGLEILTEKPYRVCFIAVERDAPHVVMVYHMRDDDMALAKHEIYGQCVKFKNCLETGIFGGYDEPENNEIEVPAWAFGE